MEIVSLKISDIKPYEKNPRKNDGAVEQVANSIKEFGFKVPIIIDKDNIIVAGHTRYKAAKKLGLTEVPCIKADDLNEDQIKAFRLADNKVSEAAEWDIDLLSEELADLQSINFDMEQFGFETAYEEENKEIVEDEAPEPPAEPKSKLGQIYQLGNHRLMCGDSTDAGVIKKLMQDAKADMVFTDPPYGMNLNTDFSTMVNNLEFAKAKGFKGGKKYEQGLVDEFIPALITTIFNNFNYCKEIFLWGADYYAEMLPNKNDGSWFVWDKRLAESADKMYGSCFELCWSKAKHKRDIARVKWAGVFGTEQEFDRKRYHPTQKPIKLASWFLTKFSKDNDLVVDLYGGSGSTLIACEQLNRCCYMVELDPRYCDVIVKRWETLTGKKAVLANE